MTTLHQLLLLFVETEDSPRLRGQRLQRCRGRDGTSEGEKNSASLVLIRVSGRVFLTGFCGRCVAFGVGHRTASASGRCAVENCSGAEGEMGEGALGRPI